MEAKDPTKGLTDTGLSPLVEMTRNAGLYDLREKAGRAFVCLADEPFGGTRKATVFAESWIEAKKEFGFTLTLRQTLLLEGRLTYFGLFGRFWTSADMKDIDRGKKSRFASRDDAPGATEDDLALLAALERGLPSPGSYESEAGLRSDGPGAAEADRFEWREGRASGWDGPSIHERGGEGRGSQSAREALEDGLGDDDGGPDAHER